MGAGFLTNLLVRGPGPRGLGPFETSDKTIKLKGLKNDSPQLYDDSELSA